jgi:hypothetical protein
VVVAGVTLVVVLAALAALAVAGVSKMGQRGRVQWGKVRRVPPLLVRLHLERAAVEALRLRVISERVLQLQESQERAAQAQQVLFPGLLLLTRVAAAAARCPSRPFLLTFLKALAVLVVGVLAVPTAQMVTPVRLTEALVAVAEALVLTA